jgi:hypothetical protein
MPELQQNVKHTECEYVNNIINMLQTYFVHWLSDGVSISAEAEFHPTNTIMNINISVEQDCNCSKYTSQ